MLYLYHVYCRDQYVVTVQAISESSAEYKVYMSHGSASRYSGPALNDFTAVKVN